MARYSVAEAKARFDDLLAAAERGEPVTITREDRAVVELVASRPVGVKVDLEWLDRTRNQLDRPVDATALVRQMRDEGP